MAATSGKFRPCCGRLEPPFWERRAFPPAVHVEGRTSPPRLKGRCACNVCMNATLHSGNRVFSILAPQRRASMNVSEFVWQRLSEWGLNRVYGYPGDGVGGLDVALEKAKDRMEYVQVRHEEMAAFMASAHAKFTGEVGLCYATSGPGAIHLLNGLYDAKMDHVPVVAIVGQQARSAIGAHYQQEVDLQSLFKDVAADYVAMASVPSQVRHMVDRAVRIA